METNVNFRRLFSLTLPFFIATIAVILRVYSGPRIIDDSYITYRYARNILAGNGFVFNPGEHVMGTTTPFYTLILVMFSLPLGGKEANFPIISYLLNSLIDGGTCLLLYHFGKKYQKTMLGVASSLAFAIAPFSVTFSIGGLETSVYVFLLVALCYTYIQEHFETAALLAATAFLTRPDAIILILPLLIDYIVTNIFYLRGKDGIVQKNRFQHIFRVTLIFTIPCAIWFSFAYFYFGSPFPHSIIAKALAYHQPENSALVRLLQHYATPFSEDQIFGKWGIAAGLFLYPSLAFFGGIQFIRNTRRSIGMVLFPWLYFSVFSLANPLIFRWYLTPPIPFYFLCIFMGVITILEQTFRNLQVKYFLPQVLSPPIQTLFTIILPTILILPAWQLHPSHGPDRLAPGMAFIQLELHYEEAARYIKLHSPAPLSHILIAAGDVGVLGYRTNAKILDTVGLNSPETLKYYPLDKKFYAINYAIPTQLILDYLPDYVVTLEVYGRYTILKSQDFSANYRLIYKIDTDIYGSNGLLIFEKGENSH
ncbi:MAG: hypothetical protein N3D16_06010 [Anaerolineales bacterium]|nr:hypothetical protein [Anaerolineales bacterium]